MVDIIPVGQGRQSDYPIGGIKALPVGVSVAEFSYVLCDGTTQRLAVNYPALYQELSYKYPSSLIDKPAGMFIVPELVHPTHLNYYQIKALPYGHQPAEATTHSRRHFGTMGATISIDVTDFAKLGPTGPSELPYRDRLMIQLFTDAASTNNWVLVPEGSYTWSVGYADPKWTLTANTAGLPQGIPYRVVIYSPALLSYYSDIAEVTLDAFDTSLDRPVSSNAVDVWHNREATTKRFGIRSSVDNKVKTWLVYDDTNSMLEIYKTDVSGNIPTPGANYGDVKAANFVFVSTMKQKKKIRAYKQSALDIIKQTKIVEYNLNSDEDTHARRIGFIAENTPKVLSGVNQNQMDLGSTVSILIKAVQELAEENRLLKKSLIKE